MPISSRFFCSGSRFGKELLESFSPQSLKKSIRYEVTTFLVYIKSQLYEMMPWRFRNTTNVTWRLWNGPHMQERKACLQRQDWKSTYTWCLSNKVFIGLVHSISSRIWEMVPEQKAKIPCKTNDWFTAYLGYIKPQLLKILYLKSPYKFHNHGWRCQLSESLVILSCFKGLSLKAVVPLLLEGLHHDQVIPC